MGSAISRSAVAARATGVARRRPDASSWTGHPAIEIALPCAVILALLFNPQIGPLAPLVMIGALPLFVWLRFERIPLVIGRCWPVLLLPAFALLSVLWSVNPAATLRYGFLFFLTALAGVLLGGGTKRDELLIGLFAAFAGYNLVAFLFGDFVGWGGPGGQAFGGLAGGKNRSGDIAALGIMTGIATIGLGLAQRRPVLVVLALLALLPSAWILVYSRATAALIACSAATACMVVWLLLARLPVQARSALFLLVAIAALTAAATQSLWREALFELVLRNTGKSADLTGRAEIWRVAARLMDERPWLGLGYNGFWIPGNFDAEALWRAFGIAERSGFNFHSTYREVVVHLGYAGMAIYVAIALGGVTGLLLGWLRRPHPTTIFFCALAVYAGMRQAFEVVGFGTVNHSAVLVFMMLARGMSAWAERDGTPHAPPRGAGLRA